MVKNLCKYLCMLMQIFLRGKLLDEGWSADILYLKHFVTTAKLSPDRLSKIPHPGPA